MLKNLDVLEQLIPPEHIKYVDAFKAFNVVVESCFSYELAAGYAKSISDFETAWTSLGLSVTTKVHLVVEHLEEACDFYGFGMALLNESAAESVHADFDRHYQGYKVKDINSPKYRERLLHAVKTYNSSHI